MPISEKDLKRRKEVFLLCKEAEEAGLNKYRDIADYVYDKSGEKTSHSTIQRYKIDRIAQEKAAGILITEKQLIKLYLDNPKLLFPELLLKIKTTKLKLKKNVSNILTWGIAIIITATGYFTYSNRQLILNLGKKAPEVEELRLILNEDYLTSVFKGINQPNAIVYGYIHVDFIEELNAPPKGILLNQEEGLIIINNIAIIELINYLDGQYGKGEVVIKRNVE